MGKTLLLVALALLTALGWWIRSKRSINRLREIEQGARCVRCDKTDMQVDADVSRCVTCGYVASMAAMAAVKVSDGEILDVARPDGVKRPGEADRFRIE